MHSEEKLTKKKEAAAEEIRPAAVADAGNGRRLLNTAVLLSVLGIASRGFGFLREIIFASAFGLNYNFDVYLVGAVIPVIINTSVVYLAQNYFIPEYHRKKSQSQESAETFFRSVFALFGAAGLLLTICLFFSSGAIISSYLGNSAPADSVVLTGRIFRIFILTIPLNALFAVMAALEQSESEFLHPAVSPLLLNLLVITAVIAFDNTLGILTIPIGNLAGCALQFLYMLFVVKKRMNMKLGFSRGYFSGITKTLSWPLLLIVLIELTGQLNLLIDRYFYSYVDNGGISSMNYALTLFTLPVTVFSFAASTVIFPEFSRQFSASQHTELEYSFTRALRALIIFFIPIMMLFYFFGDVFVRILFERGEFSAAGTQMTYEVLKMLSLSLVFYSAYSVVNKLIYSSGLARQLFWLSVVALLVKTILSYYLVMAFRQSGLALATSISYILLSICGYLIVKQKLKFKNAWLLLKTVVLYSAAALLVIFSLMSIVFLFAGDNPAGKYLTVFLFVVLYAAIVFFGRGQKKSGTIDWRRFRI